MEGKAYADRLIKKQSAWWKRLLDVQAPYRWNLRRMRTGFTLKVGCGIGRNLGHLRGQGVGIDVNSHAVQFARSRGLWAFTPDEFRGSEYDRPGRFDALLLSHVAEHMTLPQAVDLVRAHAPYVRDGGKLVLITPQEAGQRSDPTHVEFMDFPKLERISRESGFDPERSGSFPFPRLLGKLFVYNEFVLVAKKQVRS